MTIAVTAASGRLGSAVLRALQQQGVGETVVGLARTPDRARHLDLDVRPGDYTEVEQLASSLRGVDTLLLVSGNEPPEPRVQQHRNVLGAARSAGVGKVVYTSVQGPEEGSAFSPVVHSNRQTEADVRASGLDWVIGRNGIYIEPDIEAIDDYRTRGEVANCAGDGKCGYTTRSELAFAYARLLTDPSRNGRTLRLHGEPLSQAQLVDHLNHAFGTRLGYRVMNVEEYREDRIRELGEFMGPLIAGIYAGIRDGAYDAPTDFSEAAGRPHQPWDEYFAVVGHRP